PRWPSLSVATPICYLLSAIGHRAEGALACSIPGGESEGGRRSKFLHSRNSHFRAPRSINRRDPGPGLNPGRKSRVSKFLSPKGPARIFSFGIAGKRRLERRIKGPTIWPIGPP